MPLGRTRSGTNAAASLRQTTLRQSPDSHKRKRPSAGPPRVGVPQHQDVIELSSDDELPLPRKAPVSKRRPAAVAPTSETQPAPHHVLEITDSSDNDASSKPAASNSDGTPAVAFLKNKNKKLEEENNRMKKQLYSMRKDLDRAKQEVDGAKRELFENKVKLSQVSNNNLDSLEEELTCEICTIKMWSPYLLSECGHVFCCSCLCNWFSTTRTQHMNSNPAYRPLPSHLHRVLHNPAIDPNTFLHANLFLAQNPPPKYTCPACRKPVTRKPVEDFALKKVMSWLASAQGQEIAPLAAGGKSGGLLDAFFPS